ncbi:unnamed protein product [marine sediment metagenome]|uniref:Uncharacterized protein n=1 Tax=marine sediment metagenome TaxID=412755 RepID=X1E174_9ZZZZ
MREDKVLFDNRTIEPIIDNIYDVWEEHAYDEIHMVMACYIAAECFAKQIGMDVTSKEQILEKAKEVSKTVSFVKK